MNRTTLVDYNVKTILGLRFGRVCGRTRPCCSPRASSAPTRSSSWPRPRARRPGGDQPHFDRPPQHDARLVVMAATSRTRASASPSACSLASPAGSSTASSSSRRGFIYTRMARRTAGRGWITSTSGATWARRAAGSPIGRDVVRVHDHPDPDLRARRGHRHRAGPCNRIGNNNVDGMAVDRGIDTAKFVTNKAATAGSSRCSSPAGGWRHRLIAGQAVSGARFDGLAEGVVGQQMHTDEVTGVVTPRSTPSALGKGVRPDHRHPGHHRRVRAGHRRGAPAPPDQRRRLLLGDALFAVAYRHLCAAADLRQRASVFNEDEATKAAPPSRTGLRPLQAGVRGQS